jgi:hypothetical protein
MLYTTLEGSAFKNPVSSEYTYPDDTAPQEKSPAAPASRTINRNQRFITIQPPVVVRG